MTPTITRIIASALALVTGTALAQETNSPQKPSVAGQEYTHPIRYEIWAPKEVKKSTNEVFRVWIPSKVKQVRAVVVVPDYSTDRAIYFSEELGYRQFAKQYYDKKRPPFEATDTGLAVRACNALGALQASYIFPGSRHNDVKNHDFIWQWITVVTEKRLPSPLTFDKVPELKPMPRESGWIGTYDYEHQWDAEKKVEHFQLKSVTITPFADFRGDPATANWLPDEALAKAWKAKMGF